jgi:tetratricopeptide (TPR) repeat protein
MGRVKLSVENDLATELGNDRDAMLRALAERSGVEAYLRGNELTLDGDDDAVERARSVMVELAQLDAEGVSVGPQTVDAVAGVLTEDGRAVDVLHDVVWTHRGKQVSPKTIGQKRYVDAIRANTVTFGIGPAGTGKTYLAIALAVAALGESTRLEPMYAGSHYGLASALFASNDLDGAITEYRKTIRLAPKFTAAHNELGLALHRKRDLHGASAAFKEAIRLDSKNAAAHANLGHVLQAEGDFAGATTHYREAIRLKPSLDFSRGLSRNTSMYSDHLFNDIRTQRASRPDHSVAKMLLHLESQFGGLVLHFILDG